MRQKHTHGQTHLEMPNRDTVRDTQRHILSLEVISAMFGVLS